MNRGGVRRRVRSEVVWSAEAFQPIKTCARIFFSRIEDTHLLLLLHWKDILTFPRRKKKIFIWKLFQLCRGNWGKTWRRFCGDFARILQYTVCNMQYIHFSYGMHLFTLKIKVLCRGPKNPCIVLFIFNLCIRRENPQRILC